MKLQCEQSESNFHQRIKSYLSFPPLLSPPLSSLASPSCGSRNSSGPLPAPLPHPPSRKTPHHTLSSCRGPGLQRTSETTNSEFNPSPDCLLAFEAGNKQKNPDAGGSYWRRVCRGPPRPRLRCRGGEHPLGSPASARLAREVACAGFQTGAA